LTLSPPREISRTAVNQLALPYIRMHTFREYCCRWQKKLLREERYKFCLIAALSRRSCACCGRRLKNHRPFPAFPLSRPPSLVRQPGSIVCLIEYDRIKVARYKLCMGLFSWIIARTIFGACTRKSGQGEVGNLVRGRRERDANLFSP
jgi:hypothetical protein